MKHTGKNVSKFVCLVLIAAMLSANIIQGCVIYRLNQREESVNPFKQSSDEISQLYLSPAQSWETCIKDLGIQADVVLFGDSIMRWGGQKIKNFFSNIDIVNMGCSGDGIQQINIRRDMVTDVSPQKVFIMCGINNLGNEHYASNLQNGYTELFDYYQNCAADMEIYLLSILPTCEPDTIDKERIADANKILESVASEYAQVEFVDLYTEYANKDGNMIKEYVKDDGLHLNEAGYQKLCELITEYMLE